MPRSSAADDEFADRPFMVREAMRLGHGRATFTHARWHRPFAGVRSKFPGTGTLHERALQYVPRLREGERFSHTTALTLLGCPIRAPRSAPVDVSSPAQLGRVSCRGVAGHRHSPAAPEFLCMLPEQEAPVPVSPPLLAVQQSALLLPFRELVIALDYLLLPDSRRYDQQIRVTPDQLRRFAETASGRGAVRFRAAAALARVGAESRMETLMRLAGLRVGMAEPRLQLDIHDAEGKWIGRFDAADTETRCLFEYDGEQHFTSLVQRRRDSRKHQAARDAGWRILVFFHEELVGELITPGRRMLRFSGRAERPIRPALARLLDEVSGDDTEPTASLRQRPHE